MKRIGVFVLLLMSVVFSSGCTHHYGYVNEEGNYIEYDPDFLIQCTIGIEYNEETEEYQLSECNNVPESVLEDFVMRECVSYWGNVLGFEGWNDCEVNFEVEEVWESEYVWIYDHELCKRKIERCNESDYCIVHMHSWSDGATSLRWYYKPINKSRIVEDEQFYYKILGLKTWQDVNNYFNGRGMWYDQILNCYN